MFVISGALVVVALVLLLLGVTQPDLNLVYGSIVLSLVSLVLFVLGIVQRRGEGLPAAAPGPSDDQRTPPSDDHEVDDEPTDAEAHEALEQLEPSGSGAAAVAAIPASRQAPAGSPAAAPAVTGTVFVAANRPRYHVAGCRYLPGKQVEETDVEQARADGFTACGVCRPDRALAQAAEHVADDEKADEPHLTDDLDVDHVGGQAGPDVSGGPHDAGAHGFAGRDRNGELGAQDGALDEDEPVPTDAGPPVADDDGRTAEHESGHPDEVPPALEPAAEPGAANSPASRSGSRRLAAGDGNIVAAPAGSPSSAPGEPVVKAVATKPAVARAARPGAVRVPAPPRPAAEHVVVIPDRNRYHRAECRHVRGLAGAEQLSTDQAALQGYSPCGVCKP